MTAMLTATEPPTTGSRHATDRAAPVPVRREDPVATAPGEAARELDAEVARLLRVRGGELAEPFVWQRSSHRREVEAIVGQLTPIRSRIALLSSWDREARRDAVLRLAYAIVWLRLAHRRAGEYGPRMRRSTLGSLIARG